MSVKSPTVNASGKRSRPFLNIIHSLTRSAVRTWSTVTRLRTHNSTVQRTELQQSKCFTEHEYRCAQRSILRPTGKLKRPYVTPYRAIELTGVVNCMLMLSVGALSHQLVTVDRVKNTFYVSLMYVNSQWWSFVHTARKKTISHTSKTFQGV